MAGPEALITKSGGCRRFIILFLAAVAFGGCAHVEPAEAPAPSAKQEETTVSPGNFDQALLAQAIFDQTNLARAAQGVPPLARSAALDAAADQQASWMTATLEATHFSPIVGERTAADRLASVGISGVPYGENVLRQPLSDPADGSERAWTYESLAAACVSSWLNSPHHRATLLYPDYNSLGCAARLGPSISGGTNVFAVQDFIKAKAKKPRS
jgi:uncharacterized protein YkwD